MRRLTILLASLAGLAGALSGLPASAGAATASQLVSGTALDVIALTSVTPGVFTAGFSPGGTATTTGTLSAISTNPNWTLSVQDNTAGVPGHMRAAALGCSGSASSLTNPLAVTVTSPLGGVVSAGPKSISGSAQQVASASSQLLAGAVMTANYSQTVDSTEALLTGCLYSLTATYTLSAGT